MIKFDSKVGSITMFDEVGQQLLKLMGHSGTVPSALLAKDIAPALNRLKAGVQAAPAPAATQDDAEEDAREEPRVSLHQRAYPLIDLLTRAAEREADVTWTSA